MFMMKKMSAMLIVIAITSTSFGQALRKTEKIDKNQVPAAIQVALQNEFGSVPPDGFWTANFIVEREGNRSVARPLSYTYHKRDKANKIEIRYTADGKLDYAKGVTKKVANT
jgi:hypothetical protein